MITSDNIAVIDRSSGLNITTHKTHFEMVMRYIATGVYGGGYGSQDHRTALDHFERQIADQRANMLRQDAEEAEEERRAEERKKGPQVEFPAWLAQFKVLADQEGGMDIMPTEDELRLDFWKLGYAPNDAMDTIFKSA